MIDNVPSWPLELKTSLRLGSNAAASELAERVRFELTVPVKERRFSSLMAPHAGLTVAAQIRLDSEPFRAAGEAPRRCDPRPFRALRAPRCYSIVTRAVPCRNLSEPRQDGGSSNRTT